MRKLTVLVDMDDVIEELVEAWVDAINDEHGTCVSHDDILDWDIQRFFPSLTSEEVFAPLGRDEFWRTVRPKHGAEEALQRLIDDGHDVYIVTSSYYKTLPAKMDSVLFEYFPFIKWNNVIITSHKQLVRGDVLVDDGPHNLKGGSYEKIMMDAPHNRMYDEASIGAVRVHDWSEAYQEICRVASLKSQ